MNSSYTSLEIFHCTPNVFGNKSKPCAWVAAVSYRQYFQGDVNGIFALNTDTTDNTALLCSSIALL